MKVAYITAGAGGMYCGSCLQDNELVRSLQKTGLDIVLLPTYTPTRVEGENVSHPRIFMGGINIYLLSQFPWWRFVPRFFTHWLDRPGLLNRAARSSQTDPAELGALTLATLQGLAGPMRKPMLELFQFLEDFSPHVVHLTNSMFLGLAPDLKKHGWKVTCSFQGEELFIDQLKEPFKSKVVDLMRSHIHAVSEFVFPSQTYLTAMTKRFSIPIDKSKVIPLAVSPSVQPEKPKETLTNLGFFARQAPEKGFHVACEAFAELAGVFPEWRFYAGGHVEKRNQTYVAQQQNLLMGRVPSEKLFLSGEIAPEDKSKWYSQIDALVLPVTYDEPKGRTILEALTHGIPCIVPYRGSFIDMSKQFKGIYTYPPGEPVPSLVHAVQDVKKRYEELAQGALNDAKSLNETSQLERMARDYASWFYNFNSEGSMLSVTDLCKSFETPRGALKILNGVNLELRAGESLAILGPSGVGKSTLLNILGTLDHPSSGSIQLKDQDPFVLEEKKLAEFRNRHVGFVFQEPVLLPYLNLLENIALPAKKPNAEDQKRAKELCELVGLGHRMDHFPGELSGGEKQRAGIARALFYKPSLLLCDEPTGNLDPETADQITQLLFSLHKETQSAMILVTHSHELASHCERITYIKDGVLQESS